MSRRSKRKQPSSVLPELARPDETVPRRLRVEGDLKQCVVAALRELGDPRLRGVTVTRVEMTDDLQLARVYVRLGLDVAPQASPSADDKKKMLRGLEAAGGRLRRQVGHGLALRYTPSLRFYYDEGIEAQARVDQLLAEISEEAPSGEPGVDED